MTEPTVQKASGFGRWLRVLLGLSLAGNLLVLGIVAGSAWRFGASERDNRPLRTGVALMQALPEEDRKAIFAQLQDEGRPKPDRRVEAQQLADAMSAEPFDMEFLTDEVSRQIAARSAAQTAMLAIWLEHVENMDAAQRKAYAQQLLDLSERKKPGH